MTLARIAASFALTLAAYPALAEDIVIDQNAEYCANEYSDSRITLSDKSVVFYESSCDITAEAATAGGGRDLTLTCSGEGDQWTAQMQVEGTATGFRLTHDGTAQDYVRCD